MDGESFTTKVRISVPGYGTVFTMNTDGSDFTPLYSFNNGSDGGVPHGGLVLCSNTLYGTALGGGNAFGDGTVFAINTDGTGFRSLYDFTQQDAENPNAGLVLYSNTLYGTTLFSSNSTYGTVFAIGTNGSGFKVLHSFSALSQQASGSGTNSDGASPMGGLVLSGKTLYGTTFEGGSNGNGTVFKLNTDGTGFTILHDFSNGEGSNLYAGLVFAKNRLYGTTMYGGSSGKGTVFALNTDGTGFETLYNFVAPSPNSAGVYTNAGGAVPLGGLLVSGETLYGTASGGGTFGGGTIFSISLPISPPKLTIIPSGADVIVNWPSNATGFTLQSTTNLAAAVWTAVAVAAVIVDGQNTVTNPIISSQHFFRLSHQ